MGWSNNADMVGFVGNVPLVISLFGLEMEIQKTVRDLDIKKKGVSIRWEATGFWGEGLVQKALKISPLFGGGRWHQIRTWKWSQSTLKLDDEICPPLKLAWTWKMVVGRFHHFPFGKAYFRVFSFSEGNETIWFVEISQDAPPTQMPVRNVPTSSSFDSFFVGSLMHLQFTRAVVGDHELNLIRRCIKSIPSN